MSQQQSKKSENQVHRKYNMRYAKDFCERKIFWQKISWVVLLIVFCFFYKLKINGRETIPKTRFIVAPNHVCYFDPFLVAYATQKPLAYMAKKELFESSRLGALMLDELAAFAVNREQLEISTMKTVKEVFKTKDWSLGIFPEGGIRKTKSIGKITKGFAVIAKAAKCDILPVAIVGLEQYNWNPLKKKSVDVTIGTPISHELEIDEIVEQWRRQITDMNGYTLIDLTEQQEQKETVTV